MKKHVAEGSLGIDNLGLVGCIRSIHTTCGSNDPLLFFFRFFENVKSDLNMLTNLSAQIGNGPSTIIALIFFNYKP